jgi:hypothetical protein
MREFDTAAAPVAGISMEQLPPVISDLQRIRRAAEDLQIPACLATLKTYQLNYMNLTIQTLLAFVGSSNPAVLGDGLALARQEHDRYSLELVRLLGITLAPVTATPPSP